MNKIMTEDLKRNYLELNRKVIKQKTNGEILFQPRIECWYTDRTFNGGKLPYPYEGLSKEELYKVLDVSPRVYEYNECFIPYDKIPVKRYIVNITDTEQEIHIDTPVGNVSYIWQSNKSNGGAYFKTWPVKNEEDLDVMIWLENNTIWKWNQEAYDKNFKQWGNMCLPVVFIPRTTIQKAFNDSMGVEGTIYGLMDFPEKMEKYFEASENSIMRLIDVINESPIEWINFGDNIHDAVTPPYLFEKYVLPAYKKRNEKLHEAGKFTFAHWDGNCKKLLKYAKETGLDGIEAITPVPQGDVTIDEIKEGLGDDVFLIDGIPAILFDERYSEQLLLDTVTELIEKFAPKLILGISDEMSSTGNIERIKLVRDFVDNYNKSLIEKE